KGQGGDTAEGLHRRPVLPDLLHLLTENGELLRVVRDDVGAQLEDVLEAQARRFQRNAQISEGLPYLVADIGGDDPAVAVRGELARDEDQLPGDRRDVAVVRGLVETGRVGDVVRHRCSVQAAGLRTVTLMRFQALMAAIAMTSAA